MIRPGSLSLLFICVCLLSGASQAQAPSAPSFEQLLPAERAVFEREADNWLLIAGQLWNRQLLLRWENTISRLDSAAPRLPFEESEPPFYYNPVTEQATHDLLVAAAASPDLTLLAGPVVQVARDHIVVRHDSQRARVLCDPSPYARQMQVQLLVQPVESPEPADTRRRSSRRDPVFTQVDVADLIETIDPPTLYQLMVQNSIAELPYFHPKKVWIDRPQTVVESVTVGPNVSRNVATTTPGTYRWDWEYRPRRLAFMQQLIQPAQQTPLPGQRPTLALPENQDNQDN